MALYDNPLWILSHIRNSFVVSDDTGNSELVLSDKFNGTYKKIAEQEAVTPFLRLDDNEADDEFRPKSLEVRVGTHPLGYRPRCNTEIQLEKMRRDRKNAPNMKTVSWRPPSIEMSQEELDQMFPRKDPSNNLKMRERTKSDGCKEEVMLGRQKDAHKSLLSRQLDLCKDIDLNYFSDYSHVAGADSEADSKQIRIFFSMRQKTADGTLPFIRTKVNSNAKVINVIGFICYLYTKENMQPQLQPNVDAYSLYLAEDGLVEWDLPTLENHEPISRYGFSDLALVQTRKSKTLSEYSIKVTLPDGTFTVLQITSKNILLQEIMDKAMSKRQKLAQVERFKFIYNIERSDTPGVALDPTQLLSGVDASEFYIVRQNSRRYSEYVQAEEEEECCMTAVEAAAYQEFCHLKLLTRFKTKIPVVCSISEDRIEVTPNQTFAASLQTLTVKSQSRAIQLEDVVSCQLLEREGGPSVIVVTFRADSTFSKLKFESVEELSAKEMVAKLKFLINEHSSGDLQTQFNAYKDKKVQRRKTLHF